MAVGCLYQYYIELVTIHPWKCGLVYSRISLYSNNISIIIQPLFWTYKILEGLYTWASCLPLSLHRFHFRILSLYSLSSFFICTHHNILVRLIFRIKTSTSTLNLPYRSIPCPSAYFTTWSVHMLVLTPIKGHVL